MLIINKLNKNFSLLLISSVTTKLEIFKIIFTILQFQAKKTADLLNELSYFTYDIEIREIVSFKINSLKYMYYSHNY